MFLIPSRFISRLVLMCFDNVAIIQIRRLNTEASHLDDLQSGHDFEVTDVAGCHSKAELQGGCGDQ